LRVELELEKSNSCNSQFSRSKRLILFQIALLGEVEETQVFLKGKPSMFEAEHLVHCFPVRSV
jgi:hypothetical protein